MSPEQLHRLISITLGAMVIYWLMKLLGDIVDRIVEQRVAIAVLTMNLDKLNEQVCAKTSVHVPVDPSKDPFHPPVPTVPVDQ